MNNPPYWPNPNDPNNPHSQPTTAGPYPQFPPHGQSSPQWGQQAPPPPQFPTNPTQYSQPGQFGPPPPYGLPPKPPEQKWYRRTAGIILWLFLFFPVGLYLMWRYARWPKNAKWIVTGIFAFLMVVSMITNASAKNADQSAPTVQSTPQITPTIVPTPTQTATPIPTPTETPTPTQAPVQQSQPMQQPATQSQPVQSAPATGVNGNPWGYNFNPGSYIYSPNSGFCGYFRCVSTFWKDTNGYVAECGNGEYTHSGGVSGACSRDGGVEATLYQHP